MIVLDSEPSLSTPKPILSKETPHYSPATSIVVKDMINKYGHFQDGQINGAKSM